MFTFPGDVHTGIVTGGLPDIELGVPPVLDLSHWAMMILGFAGVGLHGIVGEQDSVDGRLIHDQQD
jgi:hypothetical protein